MHLRYAWCGGHRKGNRGRGSAGKIAVFGLLKRGGKIYAKIIQDASSNTLIPLIENKVFPDSVVYSDSWSGYNALDVGELRHQRINHSQVYADEANRRNHLNGIDPKGRAAKISGANQSVSYGNITESLQSNSPFF